MLQVDQMKQEQRFQAAVYGPVALEITMRSDEARAVNALEMHIRQQLFASFIVEHQADQDLLQECVPCLLVMQNPIIRYVHFRGACCERV